MEFVKYKIIWGTLSSQISKCFCFCPYNSSGTLIKGRIYNFHILECIAQLSNDTFSSLGGDCTALTVKLDGKYFLSTFVV